MLDGVDSKDLSQNHNFIVDMITGSRVVSRRNMNRREDSINKCLLQKNTVINLVV